MYRRFIKPILFLFDPERVHHFVFFGLKIIGKIPFLQSALHKKYFVTNPALQRKVFGIDFPNPVGLAAGLDKDAECYQTLSCLGFGFVEIGTITPKPQAGNPKKRLFRLKQDGAIINRMGFNNKGVEQAIKNLKGKKNIIIGGNIGKNKITPNELAVEDYKICFEALFPYVDYFVVNVSSPNTPNLRALQEKEPLKHILNSLQKINHKKQNPKPILLKIAPDLSNEQLLDIINIVSETKIAGVIATNTTIARPETLISAKKNEIGGLSGKPLEERSTQIIRFLHQESKGAFPIIGVGGIHSPKAALEKLKAGASLVQIYTGFIYEGPELIKRINQAILKSN